MSERYFKFYEEKFTAGMIIFVIAAVVIFLVSIFG